MFLWLSMNCFIFFYKRKPENKKIDASTVNGFIIGSKNFECLNKEKTLINAINSIVLLKH